VPDVFESDDFIVAMTRPGDTAASLAARYLGSASKAWMIEDRVGAGSFGDGQRVVIPRREWNRPGVYPNGYQVVPVLVYHNIGPQRKGRLLISASLFEAQMRHLKAEGYRPVRLEDFLAHVLGARQLPRKSVLLTFDDGHKGFLQWAYPLLRELEFPAVLFIQSDQIAARANSASLSWGELQELAQAGVEVHAHSKTHRDLRRAPGESDAAYQRRMQSELGYPLQQLRARLPRSADGLEAVAYPFGEWDEDLLRLVKQHGYAAGFTVRRESNAAFVPLLRIDRRQVYADWTLDDFKKNLKTFHDEAVLSAAEPGQSAGERSPTREAPSSRQRLAAPHLDRSAELERAGWLRQALDETIVALTIDPADPGAQERRRQLTNRIESDVAARIQQGVELARSSPLDARRHFLAALALDPGARSAFEALRETGAPVRFITHTVQARDTIAGLADIYYGDRSRGELIEEANGLEPGAPLPVGRLLKIPEIPGVPFLRPDR
jgi:peptidoglycan/xylan/chitin deacetylase (PgdA/CDA1 family)